MSKSDIVNEVAIFPQGELATEYFTGTVHVQPLVNPAEIEGLYTVGQVIYEPGSRTIWHTHPQGQVLLVTGGRGFYQERGKSPQLLSAGDVVVVPRDVEHWHGASKESSMVLVAISNIKGGSNIMWVKPVSDAEYEGAHR